MNKTLNRFRIGGIAKPKKGEDYDEVLIDHNNKSGEFGNRGVHHYARISVRGTSIGINDKKISGKSLAQLICKLLNRHYEEKEAERQETLDRRRETKRARQAPHHRTNENAKNCKLDHWGPKDFTLFEQHLASQMKSAAKKENS